MKKILAVALVLLMLAVLFTACGATKVLHCDYCGKAVTVPASSEMEDEGWIIACDDCEDQLGLDHIFDNEE